MKKYLTAILFALLGLSGCGDAGDPTRPNDYTPLTSIEITSVNPQIANLTSTQFSAIGNFSGLFTRDITADVLWTSDDPAVATVSNIAGTLGRATGVSAGSANISATLDGVIVPFALTVSNASISSIAISPLTPTTPKGLTAQFQAVGTFSDATTQNLSFDASWTSSDLTAATISNAVGSKGLANTVDIGSSTITATFDGTSANTLMTVSAAILNSISLSPPAPSILALSIGQFTATGTFSDGTTPNITDQVSWTSSVPTTASISNGLGTEGQVSTLLDGLTNISASLDGKNADTLLRVTGGNLSTINVLPANSTQTHLSPVIPIQMSAEGVFANGARDITAKVTWSSSNIGVATIDNQGIVTTLGNGTTVISAVNGPVTGTTNLTVTTATFTPGSLVVKPLTADQPKLTPATSLQFLAEGDFSDGSTRDLTSEVTWASSAPAVATVDGIAPHKGLGTGVAAGTTTISADFRGLDSDSSVLMVNTPVLLLVTIDTPGGSILPGESLQLSATAHYDNTPLTLDITGTVTWTSADTAVAIFHDAVNVKGEILGVDSGSVVVTATFGGMTDTVTFVVP